MMLDELRTGWLGRCLQRLAGSALGVAALLALALFGLPADVLAQTVTASNGLSCVGARGGSVTCTAGEFTATVSITKAPGAPDTCVAGQYFNLDAAIGLSGSNANRYNIGFFTGEDGNDPRLAAGTCSVATFPTSPVPWRNYDGNACGDYQAAGVSSPLVQNLRTKCVADASGQLQVPYVVTYQQNSGTCSGPGNVTNGSPSKCNAGTSTVSGIWVVPAISINDGVTTVASGSSTTYTVVISNPSGAAMSNLVFKDPAVAGIALNGVSCSAAGGAVCPASPTVAALQGAGLTIPSLPNGGSLTFSIPATLTGAVGTMLTNTVSVALASGQQSSASDTDQITQGCSPPANTPAGLALTCVCDTFGRATLNPSTIFGSNWVVSTSDATGILPRIVNPGYLRLTENTGANAKAATVPGIFPAAGNYISVEFQNYAYNGSGADGIAVTLSDQSVPAVPGAFGGSLGYAQKSNPGSDCTKPGGCPGFAGGWIGVAIDEYGNFQSASEGRVGGPGRIPDSVSMRGSGSGMTGYRYLGGTGTLSPEVDNAASTSPSRGHYYQVIVDARNEPASTSVAVNRDTGSGYTSLISIPNVYAGGSQAPVPANWLVSFTGSTGGLTNIHEIGGLRICAQTIYPPTGGTASGFNAIDEAYGNPPLAVQNYLTGHIYMKLVGVPFKLNVAALNNNQIQTSYVVSGTKNVTVKLVDNSDNVCVLDSAQANYCNSTCTAKVAVPGGSQTLSFAPANAGQKQSADFTLNTAWKKLAAIISDGTTTACATDSFSVRPTAVTSVVSTTATNGATSGSPAFRAGNDVFNLVATIAGVAGNASGYSGVLKINNAALQPVSPATVAGFVAPDTFPAATPGTGSAQANGATFTYSEVGAFSLPGYNPASDTSSPRGVYDGVQTATECATLTAVQCDSLKLSTSWSGIDSVSTANDCIPDSYSNAKVNGKYGCNFGLSTGTAAVGRFHPNEFVVSGVTLTNRQAAATAVGSNCPPPPAAPAPAPQPSSFTYLDEAMGFSFTLEARAGAGNVTRNYAGDLAKLALTPSATSVASLAFGAAVPAGSPSPAFSALTSRLSATGFDSGWPAMGAANAGTAALAGTVTISSLNTPANNRVAPDGPFTGVQIGIAPVDSDNVRILAYDLDVDNSGGPTGPDHRSLNPPPTPPATVPAPTTLHFGQMRFWPAHGSELQPLAIGAEILRWNGAAFVPNGVDSCTRLPLANQGLRDYARNLGAGETAITSGVLVFTAGKGRIVLSAPGNGNNGSVNVWGDLATAGLGYLLGRWPALPGPADATPTRYDNPPWATATFGVYKGQWIDMRENFFY